MAAGLRILVVVNHAGLHLEEQHHRMIFVNRVVAVHGPIALEVAEAEEESSVLVKLKSRDILARHFDIWDTRTCSADAASSSSEIAVATITVPVTAGTIVMTTAVDSLQNLVLFQMDVDGVLPIVTRIYDHPILRGVLRYGETQFITDRKSVV